MKIVIRRPMGDPHIYVETPSATYADWCKSVPGHRWLRAQKAWRYPATPAIARELHSLFRELPHYYDERFKKLLRHNRTIRLARRIKKATRLRPIPLTKMEPWLDQLRAYHYIRKIRHAMVHADMGTGKTKVVLDLIMNENLQHTLVLCPKAAMDVWATQMKIHAKGAPRLMTHLVGTPKQRYETAEACYDVGLDLYPIRIMVINYESMWREPFASWALNAHWDLVVADESHRIKAPGTKASLFMYRLSLQADRRVCLTGTPMPNNPLDVYGQYRFLDVGIFGSNFDNFRSTYAVMGGFENRQILKFKNLNDLRRKMYSIGIRILEDSSSLPPETVTHRHTELDQESRTVYKALDKEFITEVATGKITADNALVKMLRLQEITSGFITKDKKEKKQKRGDRISLNTVKADLLADTLQDIKKNTPLVVFARFVLDLRAIHTKLQEAGWSTGELSGKHNDLADFQNGKIDALVIQIQSGKESIDLTRARYGIYYSLSHSLGDYQQSRKRIRRPGQKHPHTYIHLIVKGTVDAEMMRAIEQKKNIVQFVTDLRRLKRE